MAIKLNDEVPAEAARIHGAVVPLELTERDPVKARVLIGTQSRDVVVKRYSPFGIEFVNTPDTKLDKGSEVSVVVRLGDDETTFSGLVVDHLYKHRDMLLVGVRTFRPQVTGELQGDRRQHIRWNCSDDYIPRGRAANPLVYNDFILFWIENVSAGGLRIVTSMRNKLLGVGQRLDCTISLPLVGSVQATLVIKTIDTKAIKGKQELVLGTQFVSPGDLFKMSLAEYLLNFAENVTIGSLMRDGYPIRRASKWLDFTYVKTQEEYQSVLHLRHATYLAENKISPDKKVMDMADEFDSRAQILIAKHKGKIVGSLRAMFHDSPEQSDIGRYVRFPAEFPKFAEIVEATRVCTHAEFRGADIMYQLMAHLLLTAIKHGRRFVVGGAAGSLVEFYAKIGFKPVGVRYRSLALDGIEHELIMMDTHEVALGRGIGIKPWNQLYGPVIDYMVENEIVVPSNIDLMRISLKRTVGALLFSR
ncbi:MAG: GNAT family N-acetyltransferase [Bdellovibrionales bacterium]|nr:GNAT family N-acetyltransferase [Bdellovibrionales bacterium]